MRFAAKVNIYTKENIRSERTDKMYTCMINGVIYVCGDGVGLLVPFFTTGNISNGDVHFSWRSSSCHTLIPIVKVHLSFCLTGQSWRTTIIQVTKSSCRNDFGELRVAARMWEGLFLLSSCDKIVANNTHRYYASTNR